jgi:hypothetical protein
MKRSRRDTGPDLPRQQVVIARAGGNCERCGEPAFGGFSIHHRSPRRMGGTSNVTVNLPSNLLLLCGTGITGCHGEVESQRAQSLRAGWLVPSGANPAEYAVLVSPGRFVYLTDDGTYATEPPERC